MDTKGTEIQYEISPKNNFSLGITELWFYRELFFFFTWRDIKVKYKQTVFGIFWAALQPLAMMAIFTLVFSKGLKVGSEGMPYPVFAFSGLIIWNIFSNGLLNSANSMINNAGIIKKIYFPRLIIPISAILTSLFDFCFSFIIFLGVLIYYNHTVNIGMLLICIPLCLLLTIIVTFGLGSFLAAWNVKYRDFQYALPFLMQFLLFVNPVLYSSKAFKESWFLWVMKLNPIAGAINLLRSSLSNTEIDWEQVLLSFGVGVIIFFIGLYTFRKTENYFADLA